MLKLFLVFLGGGCGASLRYGAGVLVARMTPADADTPHWLSMYPVATFGVNLLGCALIGLAWGLLGEPKEGDEAIRLALVVGVLGGFTTFSSFGWEMLDLMQSGRVLTAIVYAALSVGIGLLCAWAGHALGLSLSAGS
ncbi:MAG: fluoride efflux transporter CrcB [Phycisphaerales bacterium]|nr:fluoride efflux transporter CrcB [Phycisphaerales bacterium]